MELMEYLSRLATIFREQCPETTNKSTSLSNKHEQRCRQENSALITQQNALQQQTRSGTLRPEDANRNQIQLLVASANNAIHRKAFCCQEATGYVLRELLKSRNNTSCTMMRMPDVEHTFLVLGLLEDNLQLTLQDLITAHPNAIVVDLWAQGPVKNQVYKLTEFISKMTTLLQANEYVFRENTATDITNDTILETALHIENCATFSYKQTWRDVWSSMLETGKTNKHIISFLLFSVTAFIGMTSNSDKTLTCSAALIALFELRQAYNNRTPPEKQVVFFPRPDDSQEDDDDDHEQHKHSCYWGAFA